MAIIPLSFTSGGILSSDVTATAAQVLAGYTALTSDSNDEPIEGTMHSYAGQTQTASASLSSGYIRFKVPNNGYYSTASYLRRSASSFGDAATADVRTGKKFTSSAGYAATGTMPEKAAATLNTSPSDQTIAAGQYLTGDQTILAVRTANISAANIKKGVVIKVGDSADDDRISNVTGTYTTVSSGQTAVTAGAMLAGYSGFANGGAEVRGTIASKAAATYYPLGTTQTIAAGQYLSGAQTLAGVATSGLQAANVKRGAVIKVGDSADDDRIASVTGTYTTVSSGQNGVVAGALLEGYSGFANGGAEVQGTMKNFASTSKQIDGADIGGTIAFNTTSLRCTMKVPSGVNLRAQNTEFYGTVPMSTKTAETYNVSSSNRTIPAGQYITGAQTIRGVTTSGITAGNIKKGVTIKVGDSADDDRITAVTGSCPERKQVVFETVYADANTLTLTPDNNTAKTYRYIDISAADLSSAGIVPESVTLIGGGDVWTCGAYGSNAGANIMDGTNPTASGYIRFSDAANTGKCWVSSANGIRLPVCGAGSHPAGTGNHWYVIVHGIAT